LLDSLAEPDELDSPLALEVALEDSLEPEDEAVVALASVAVAVEVFVESAGSWPEASCT
jgi:hypothetical protein